jgi:sugar phosphate isomerase/epimerase
MIHDNHSAAPSVSRRDALAQLAALAAMGVAAAPALASTLDAPRRIERIGLQLYTVRRAMAHDLLDTLNAIAAAGITEVEFAGYYEKSAAWWRTELSARGLTTPATHVGLPPTDTAWAPHLDLARQMGHRYVIVPFVGNDFRGVDGYRRLADRLNAGGALAQRLELTMGYHNHDFELSPLPSGENGLDVLLANTDPALVSFELDLYWCVKGGADPLRYLTQHSARFSCCHVKDAGPAPERDMRDVGAGTIDFRSIIATGRKGALRHWFIEHDNPTDPLASIAASARAMRAF